MNLNNALPQHIAIIMDGNGRWAKQQGKKRTQGHKEGAKVVQEITQWCANQKIPFLTLYAFSTENWKRPKMEIDYLMKLLEKYLKEERTTYIKNNIRFRVIGDIDAFSTPLKNAIFELEHLTQNHTNLTQILALNYGSHNEIARTFLKLANSQAQRLSKLTTQEVTELINANLDTATLPNVDMLIRTGGEKRISNFLLWQASYAELFFTPTLWPDFTANELDSLLSEFSQRQRRFGGL
ncbi:undecaprenyl diphosphate synthetase [Helicobacter cinaedi PAGU611]|uniref:Isoprenyl transferase n=1 Tax=Helicobacter cinaedi CCUG 18818 = ATCC BAA-847 TaxID=537971 RepID=A0AAI8MLY1_9HELI|nr:di-trans,poly-cis-decaprenylcistransferase [Helicobacter cinaedi]QOQ90452.1 di-trans,poly-cis-decaprenylcistransferase [Helicobacter cinaedi]BAM11450.1 undecaprenyl diphosphate synthetase [Helicobacter cinaedi PAGU611]BAM31372.1 undecaprenyl diphosphate synthetase [Helicobacter cinaedi CCUG 18818 = ATCC BAA-847]BBB18951.1 undecaprenyl diphosphate synthase [Helicobacter cinaedi]